LLKNLRQRLAVRALESFPLAVRLADRYVVREFDRHPRLTRRAYALFNPSGSPAAGDGSSEAGRLIERAREFGYLAWPKRLRPWVQGKDVLDVGCGTGVHGVGFAVVGVRSYVGVDPKIRLDMKQAKNTRTRGWEPFGWTPAEIMRVFPQVRIVPGTFEAMPDAERFDVAVLHNSTEHLMAIEEVLAGIARRLRPGGQLIYNHHNFYCWNGHHMRPKSIGEIDAGDAGQQPFIDWAHLVFEPPPGHYFHRGLNRIRLDELKAATERHYDIQTWNEIASDEARGAGRLTPAIRERFPGYSARELLTQHVFCVARPKG
jgi:SAM-dependent methyltransferase